MKTYDFIIIGAGHNGLVAATYLAQRGKKVLVLERRENWGGQVVTETFADGFTANSLYAGGMLHTDIVRDLKLTSFGLQIPANNRKPFISLQQDGNHLVLDDNAAESIKKFSAADAARWPEFLEFMKKCTKFIHAAYATIMPRLPADFNMSEGSGLAKLGLDLRMMGGKDMMRIIRGMPMTATEFLDEWFESETLKAAIGSLGIHGFTLGIMGAGTGFTLMHNWASRGGLSHPVVPGGVGKITDALAAALKSSGGEMRTNAEVKKIPVDIFTCKGVVLSNGEEIQAKSVVSAADPKHTFLTLVGAPNLPPEFVWHTQSIKMRGSVSKVHLLTDGKHGIPDGTIVVAPSFRYLEKAYDAAKYHGISEEPYLEITSSGNVVTIHFQFGAFKLKNSTWDKELQTVQNRALQTAVKYFPNLEGSLKNVKTLTPQDLQDTYGLTEGDLNHGQLMLDQFTFMRPIPGWSNHRTPIDNLYLCGSGVHGGGGISGAAGRNAAKVLS